MSDEYGRNVLHKTLFQMDYKVKTNCTYSYMHTYVCMLFWIFLQRSVFLWWGCLMAHSNIPCFWSWVKITISWNGTKFALTGDNITLKGCWSGATMPSSKQNLLKVCLLISLHEVEHNCFGLAFALRRRNFITAMVSIICKTLHQN